MINEAEIRSALFIWLKQKSAVNGGVFTRDELLSGFKYQGRVITLVGPSGIWTPKGFNIPISISTTSSGGYDDDVGEDTIISYRYRGNDPNQHDNVGLREAFRARIPLVYFQSIKPGKYFASWPVYIVDDRPADLLVRAVPDPVYAMANTNLVVNENAAYDTSESGQNIRRYVTALTRQRLHQTAFREFVLDAYNRQCTMCKLRHPELLDAAHITPDSDPYGAPVIQNGLSLCKIHHAAYDQQIIGISPDYDVRVRTDILSEIDGPMLKHGLQELEGNKIVLPSRRADYPDQNRLALRFEKFLKAS
ncbi:HNH endonuclease [bacterium]|nr:HNH endonuclease [bacterium]